ncbi:MAG TPA: riboflavin synthase [Vicinamibacterales bacterium]|nr:riboflavin synthase [Vicinamibacterales bacterium]
MFTGLVREIGRVARLARRGGITTIEVEAPLIARPPGGTAPAVGDSLAVNGICLTLVGIARTRVSVEATAETRRVTTLDDWRAGDLVHLEPSLRVGDQLGGHFVLGHVDGTGRLARLDHRGSAAWMTVSLPRGLAGRLLPKGSVAVDGVSLTLDEGPFEDRFTVTLIPHTLEATRFGGLAPGTRLNLELDVLSKAAQPREVRRPLTIEALRDRGWGR